MIMPQDVFYYSNGYKIAASLFVPKGWRPGDESRPAIVALAGYSGIQDYFGADIHRRFSKEGCFVLAPDYQGFGRSQGVQGRHRPLEQAQNAYDAITYLETLEGIDPDRIGIYGRSFGGGNAIWVGAFDRRAKVIVSVVGVHDGERWMRSVRRPHEWYSLQQEVWDAARRRVTTGTPTMKPRTEIVLSDPISIKTRKEYHEQSPYFQKEFDVESVEACWRYKPEWVAPRIAPRPVLIIYSEYDFLVPVQEALSCYEACGEPKKLVKLPKAHHYDSYIDVNPEAGEICMREAVAWYNRFL